MDRLPLTTSSSIIDHKRNTVQLKPKPRETKMKMISQLKFIYF